MLSTIFVSSRYVSGEILFVYICSISGEVIYVMCTVIGIVDRAELPDCFWLRWWF
jgi:hypothetical protein